MRAQDFKHKLPVYSKREETANFVTHLIGAVFSFIAFPILLWKGVSSGDAGKAVCAAIYGISLIILFSCSTLYHASVKNEERRRKLQKGDHLSIGILTAGSVTGFVGGSLTTPGAYYLIGFAWLLTVLATILNSLSVKAFRAPAMACFIGAGWAPFLIIPQLLAAVGALGLSLLGAGGFFIMLGLIVFYPIKKEFMHATWHCFVLIGCIIHFTCVAFVVL